jgi:hypothetical protein
MLLEPKMIALIGRQIVRVRGLTIGSWRHMAETPIDEAEEHAGFWGDWKRLYLFLLAYGIVQIVLLYLFTRALNQS